MHASNGILFNHESPAPRRDRRAEGPEMRRAPPGAASSSACRTSACTSGTSSAQRDWGHAKDYVEGMWRMLQQDTPWRLRARHRRHHHDSGLRDHGLSVRSDITVALARRRQLTRKAGLSRRPATSWSRWIPRYFRPAEVDLLIGDAAEGRWRSSAGRPRPPSKRCREMVQSRPRPLRTRRLPPSRRPRRGLPGRPLTEATPIGIRNCHFTRHGFRGSTPSAPLCDFPGASLYIEAL